jgi:hypothetical protein
MKEKHFLCNYVTDHAESVSFNYICTVCNYPVTSQRNTNKIYSVGPITAKRSPIIS